MKGAHDTPPLPAYTQYELGLQRDIIIHLKFITVTGGTSNKWSSVTIRLGMRLILHHTHLSNSYMLHVHGCKLYVFQSHTISRTHSHTSNTFEALAIFSRSPSAYHAVRSLGILQLPCDRTLRGYMYRHASSPGINEEALLDRAQKYEDFKKERVAAGFVRPVGEGVLIWDEVKV